MQEKIRNIYLTITKKGEYITLKKPNILQKLAIPREGPYKVIKHNHNGSILLKKCQQKSKMLICEELLYIIARLKLLL